MVYYFQYLNEVRCVYLKYMGSIWGRRASSFVEYEY